MDPLEMTIIKGMRLNNQKAGNDQTHSMHEEVFAVPTCEDEAEMVAALESLPQHFGKPPNPILIPVSTSKLLPSVIQAPILELKPLPDHLKYVYLGEKGTLRIIVSSTLTAIDEEKLIRVLKEHKTTIGWTLADIKGISSTTCIHRILLKEVAKPTRQVQPSNDGSCRVIYPISDSCWVSPVQVVPKKSGMTVVKNAENECVPTRIQTGWRMCIDYWKLNATTRKDHFLLPFIDQMLKRLADHSFYCFLDGYLGYNQIVIAPDDQEKTTFTCLLKDVPFKFDEECEKAFKHLKEMLTLGLIIVPPDWSLPFELMCDASDYAFEAVLGQRKNKQPHVIYYAPWTLNDA
ncbi:uncharacterized protein [Pyrus communis]|uniref:uncharacterized protein n=1 Tax=Pyrus communis TaxID=23211 RepID=UPI0035BEDEA1